jgi:hypothetical protein
MVIEEGGIMIVGLLIVIVIVIEDLQICVSHPLLLATTNPTPPPSPARPTSISEYCSMYPVPSPVVHNSGPCVSRAPVNNVDARLLLLFVDVPLFGSMAGYISSPVD